MDRSFNIFSRILIFFILLKGQVHGVPYLKEISSLIDHAYLTGTFLRILSSYIQPNATNPDATGYTELFEPARIAEPMCPNKYIEFYLFNKNYPTTPVKLKMDSSIKNILFIRGAKIKILFHGYTGDMNDTPNLQCRPRYIELNHNVVSVSYPALVRFNFYPDIVKNVQTIANCSALMIEHIVKNRKDIKLCQFHVIGFSLGGQIVGQIHHYLSIGQLRHATGIEVGYPGFDNVTHYSITSRCAKFTDTYMSNAGIIGVPCPWADVNFVINGGTLQPTCPLGDCVCDHEYAAILYCLSVNPQNKFVGQACDGPVICSSPRFRGKNSSELAGAYVSSKARGTYCVTAKDIKSITIAELVARKLAGQM